MRFTNLDQPLLQKRMSVQNAELSTILEEIEHTLNILGVEEEILCRGYTLRNAILK